MFHKYQVYVHIRYKAPSGTSIQSHDRINCSTRTKLSSCSFYVLCVFVCGLLKLNSKLRIRPVRTLCVCRAVIDLAQALALQMPLILNISDFCFHCCNINSSSGLLFVVYSVDNGERYKRFTSHTLELQSVTFKISCREELREFFPL